MNSVLHCSNIFQNSLSFLLRNSLRNLRDAFDVKYIKSIAQNVVHLVVSSNTIFYKTRLKRCLKFEVKTKTNLYFSIDFLKVLFQANKYLLYKMCLLLVSNTTPFNFLDFPVHISFTMSLVKIYFSLNSAKENLWEDFL